ERLMQNPLIALGLAPFSREVWTSFTTRNSTIRWTHPWMGGIYFARGQSRLGSHMARGGTDMSSTKWLLLIPLAAIAGAVGAPSLADANDDDIVIGFATSRSGFMAQYDDNPTKMAQVFIDEANAKGGLLGRKLRAVFADAKSDRVEGVRAAQAVVRQGPDLVFGSCDYDWGSPAVFEAQKAGKISVYICAEDPKAGIAGPNAFTTSAVAQAQGVAMADWAIDKKGIRT